MGCSGSKGAETGAQNGGNVPQDKPAEDSQQQNDTAAQSAPKVMFDLKEEAEINNTSNSNNKESTADQDITDKSKTDVSSENTNDAPLSSAENGEVTDDAVKDISSEDVKDGGAVEDKTASEEKKNMTTTDHVENKDTLTSERGGADGSGEGAGDGAAATEQAAES